MTLEPAPVRLVLGPANGRVIGIAPELFVEDFPPATLNAKLPNGVEAVYSRRHERQDDGHWTYVYEGYKR